MCNKEMLGGGCVVSANSLARRSLSRLLIRHGGISDFCRVGLNLAARMLFKDKAFTWLFNHWGINTSIDQVSRALMYKLDVVVSCRCHEPVTDVANRLSWDGLTFTVAVLAHDTITFTFTFLCHHVQFH